MTKVFIIAEAGVNHNGSLQMAKRLVDIASDAGANFIKFQSFDAEEIVTKSAPKANYQKKNSGNNENQYQMLKKLEFQESWYKPLIDYCQKKNIEFFSTAFDIQSLKKLNEYNQNLFKIPSGEITNVPLLREIARFNKETLMSTGMANVKDIAFSIKTLLNAGLDKSKLVIMHCTTQYPSPLMESNLLSIKFIKDKFNVRVGFSDHTKGYEAAIIATSIGIEYYEKHITINNNMVGPDHKASANPKQFENLIKRIRKTEIILGNYEKKPLSCELENIPIARRSIYASKDIKAGEKFSKYNLTLKRPALGICASQWDKLIGKVAKYSFKKDQLIKI